MNKAPLKYRIVVEWDEDDEIFVARVPAIDGCMAHGDTADAATREATIAARAILDVMKDDGRKLPAPDVSGTYSGNFRTRVPRSLHKRLAEAAAAEGVSLNQFISGVLAQAVGECTSRRSRAS